jgi:hypothetical protein
VAVSLNIPNNEHTCYMCTSTYNAYRLINLQSGEMEERDVVRLLSGVNEGSNEYGGE